MKIIHSLSPSEIDFEHVKPGYLPVSPSVRVHHIIENLLTSWTHPDDHILPLRVFLENILNSNLEQRTANSYLRNKLRHKHVGIPAAFYAAS